MHPREYRRRHLAGQADRIQLYRTNNIAPVFALKQTELLRRFYDMFFFLLNKTVIKTTKLRIKGVKVRIFRFNVGLL